VGKTQTAFEYAHPHLEIRRFVGVVDAERAALIPGEFARILKLPAFRRPLMAMS